MINNTDESHRRMGMAAIWMARNSGVSPLALGDQREERERGLPQWITAWFLQQANQMSLDGLSRCLGLPQDDVKRMLSQLGHVRSTRPELDEWMTQLEQSPCFRGTTVDEEAA